MQDVARKRLDPFESEVCVIGAPGLRHTVTLAPAPTDRGQMLGFIKDPADTDENRVRGAVHEGDHVVRGYNLVSEPQSASDVAANLFGEVLAPLAEAASGYAGVWATENTREAIFDAMKRKEVYATTGSRILVRFFGGWEFEEADAQQHFEWFEQYADAATQLMDKGLVLPAYDFIMKASHTFNVLDARNAISVTERQKYIGRIRKLSRAIATAYLESRRQLDFPMLPPEQRERYAHYFADAEG